MRILFFLIIISCSSFSFGQVDYFPERNDAWETKEISEFNIDAQRFKSAIEFAKAHPNKDNKDLIQSILKGFESEPYHKILGPTKERGEAAGMILKDGYLISSWGDLERVDMTFSVTKSYLSTVAGLAYDNDWITDIDQPISEIIWNGNFNGRHNSKITWRHLLTQSSDWSGQLWGGYDWADRPPRDGDIDDWKLRTLSKPGTNFEYNDVRVNLLAHCLLEVWRKPLPQVLKQHIMDPIGASSTWRWYGYDNSWVTIDGVKMQSVSGGGHSGGGLFINTLDHARFGLLFLNEGNWDGKQLISKKWIEMATRPSNANNNYGFMWWLDPDDSDRLTNISDKAYYAAGFGGNYIIIEPEHNLVVVLRWMDNSKLNEFLGMLYKSFE